MGRGEFSTTNCPSEDASGNSFCATATGNSRYQCKKPGNKPRPSASYPATAASSIAPSRAPTVIPPLLGRNRLRGCERSRSPYRREKTHRCQYSRFKRPRGFAGAWFRTRVGSWPINFADAARERYAADRHVAAPSLDQLRQTPSLLADYRAWWQEKRRAYLTAIRDHIRTGSDGGVPGASVLLAVTTRKACRSPLPTTPTHG